MNLKSKHLVEKRALENLAKSIKDRATDPDELARILYNFESFNGFDPIPHIILAMDNYLAGDKDEKSG